MIWGHDSVQFQRGSTCMSYTYTTEAYANRCETCTRIIRELPPLTSAACHHRDSSAKNCYCSQFNMQFRIFNSTEQKPTWRGLCFWQIITLFSCENVIFIRSQRHKFPTVTAMTNLRGHLGECSNHASTGKPHSGHVIVLICYFTANYQPAPLCDVPVECFLIEYDRHWRHVKKRFSLPPGGRMLCAGLHFEWAPVTA